MFYESIKTTWKNLVTEAPHILFPDNYVLHCFHRGRINEGFLKTLPQKEVPRFQLFVFLSTETWQ